MRTFGLIGRHLQHSFSPAYFAQKFQQEGIKDAVYQLFPLPQIEAFPALLNQEDTLVGLNVTIPYKEVILPFLDHISPLAKSIGAVNTIEIREGKLIGHNTDVYGFQVALEQLLSPQQRASKALVLGTGGASKAVCSALQQLEIPYQLVSRTAKNNVLSYEQLKPQHLKDHLIIINTSPLGMHPNVENCPSLPYQVINEQHLLFDLIYNPKQTLFLKKGLAQGASISNGLAMLHLQADRAWEIWTK